MEPRARASSIRSSTYIYKIRNKAIDKDLGQIFSYNNTEDLHRLHCRGKFIVGDNPIESDMVNEYAT